MGLWRAAESWSRMVGPTVTISARRRLAARAAGKSSASGGAPAVAAAAVSKASPAVRVVMPYLAKGDSRGEWKAAAGPLSLPRRRRYCKEGKGVGISCNTLSQYYFFSPPPFGESLPPEGG